MKKIILFVVIIAVIVIFGSDGMDSWKHLPNNVQWSLIGLVLLAIALTGIHLFLRKYK